MYGLIKMRRRFEVFVLEVFVLGRGKTNVPETSGKTAG